MNTLSCCRQARPRSRFWKVNRQGCLNQPSSGVLIVAAMIVKKGGKCGTMERLVRCAATDTCFEIGIDRQFIAAQFRFRANCASAIAAAPVGGRVHR